MADYAEKFKCKDGEEVSIEIDDTSNTATVFDLNGREIGRLEFDEREGPSLKLMWAYLDLADPKYKHQGIGRRILQIMIERSGMPIIAEEHTGIPNEEGSHLTGDAPSFVARMQDEGLIVRAEEVDADDAEDPQPF